MVLAPVLEWCCIGSSHCVYLLRGMASKPKNNQSGVCNNHLGRQRCAAGLDTNSAAVGCYRRNGKILKTNLVYITPRWYDNGLWNMPQRSFGETQQVHDPLVVIAHFFSDKILINDEDKISILKSLFNGRHQTEERLWTGIDLHTQQVISTIRLWPENHLAYTEKIITVTNNSNARWQHQQEAIYTFQLPEGSVVTSLSLWIGSFCNTARKLFARVHRPAVPGRLYCPSCHVACAICRAKVWNHSTRK
jgi:hypothetical protein